MVARAWIVLDIEKLPRPPSVILRMAWAARLCAGPLPDEFKPAACVWQLSGSSGGASRLDEIRIHLFFKLDATVFPSAWKGYFAGSKIVDPSAFDKAKLIFTAAPIIELRDRPDYSASWILAGEPTVIVPMGVIEQSARIATGATQSALRLSCRMLRCRTQPPRLLDYREVEHTSLSPRCLSQRPCAPARVLRASQRRVWHCR